MKKFNTAGICFPEEHCRVDISGRVGLIKEMVDRGDYSCINRGHQYGNTTVLRAVRKDFLDTYTGFSICFESTADSTFTSIEKLCSYFLWQLKDIISYNEMGQMNSEAVKLIKENDFANLNPVEVPIFKSAINKMCALIDKSQFIVDAVV